MRILLLNSDLEHELKPMLDYIRALIRAQSGVAPWGEELDRLVQTVLDLDLDAVAQPLAEFATQPAIPDIRRFAIIKWLLGRKDPELPRIIAWWLNNERYGKYWITNAANSEWGDYGKRLLHEAEQISRNAGEKKNAP